MKHGYAGSYKNTNVGRSESTWSASVGKATVGIAQIMTEHDDKHSKYDERGDPEYSQREVGKNLLNLEGQV